MFEVNRALLLYFVEAIETKDFCEHSNIHRLRVKQFLEWIMSSKTVPEKKIEGMVRARTSTHLKSLNLTIFANFFALHCQKIGTEQIWQVLRASLAVAVYEKKDPRVCYFFYTLFRTGQSSVPPINGNHFLQTDINFPRQGAVVMIDSTTWSDLEVHSFHSIAVVEIAIIAKALKCSRS